MSDLKILIAEHLGNFKIMQLATTVHDEPWVVTLHYYGDDQNNMYWISRENREHSEHIMQNSHVAATIVVHENTPTEEYVISVSMKGTAEIADNETVQKIGDAYLAKLNKNPQEIADILSGDKGLKMYVLKPSKITLFDTKTFPDDPRKELTS